MMKRNRDICCHPPPTTHRPTSASLGHTHDTKNIHVNQAHTDGRTPLWMACQEGHAEVVSVLLDKARDTIDVNQARTDDGSGDLV